MPAFMENLPGAVVKVVAHIYDSQGGIAAQAVQIPEELLVEQLVTIDFFYDAGGRLLNMTATMENSLGLNSYIVDCTYDAAFNLAETKAIEEYDYCPKDGWIDKKGFSETKYTYDGSGNLITKVTNYFGSSYRAGTYETTTYEYEGSLLVKEDRRLLDRSGDSVLDQDTITYAYDASGRIVTKVEEEDKDGDPSTENRINTYTYGYGQWGLISYHLRYQYPGAVETETGAAYTYTYNDQGQLTEKLQNSRGGFEREEYFYDTEGRLISVVQSDHPSVGNFPGTAEWKDTTTYVYGDDGRLNGWTNDLAANGTDVNYRSIVELTYDESGTSAVGTITDYRWDDVSAAFVTEGLTQSMSFTFAAGVPTATMEIPVNPMEYHYPANDFEKITWSVKHPALMGIIYYSSFSFLMGPI
jgi:hypothetical protein